MASGECSTQNHGPASLNRSSFPAGFVFGTASSAYQYEGAANDDGRGPSIWDTFTQKYPDKIKDGSSGVVAIDSYHRYKEDVALMKDIGFDAYRFSISWSRILPYGNLRGGVNPQGITYYNNLINQLLSNGLQPFVTLFHWDLPQALEDEYGGFLHPQIVNDFQDYVELCYRNFGDRVKQWITVNEPLTFASLGYANGEFAPGRCSNCSGGNSGTEPYIVSHHLLLAHAAAVKLYRDKYQMSQKGQIGITLNCAWIVPLNIESETDHQAASRSLSFSYDWFLEPLKSGSYPADMVNNVGERLPRFNKEQSLMVKGSFDFLGLNYYTSNYATNINTPCKNNQNPSYLIDSCVNLTKGIRHLLLYTKNKLNNPVIYITENGVDEINDGKLSLEDNMRIEYYKSHLSYVQSGIMEGVNVRGYFAWSFLDNFEWSSGYTVRFGTVYVDYEDGLKRGSGGNDIVWQHKQLAMAIQKCFLFLFCIFLALLARSDAVKPMHYSMPFNRSLFPADFTFGAGSAAYQSEGAASIDGRGPSIWDTFTKNHPEKIWDRKSGEVADDFYHRYKDDIQIMKRLGLNSFRFSMSWSRLLPKGKLSGGVNPLGVKFYNNVINELLANGLTPFVTLFHWDLPQALEDEYAGFLSSKIVKDFQDYSDFCFKTFGDRVKHWATMNEPYSYSNNGYNGGTFAPGRCSTYMGNCTAGDSSTEPYIVAHNLLLSHAVAVKIYKTKYQAYQKGQIGITIVTNWFIPKSANSVADQNAVYRMLDFLFGWFADPIIHGDYPKTMRTLVGNRLPKFTAAQSNMLKGSIDFLGVNYYTTNYAAHTLHAVKVNMSYSTDPQVTPSTALNGIPIGTPTPLSWLFIYPKGIKELMLYIKDKYNNPPIYITENGLADANNESLSIEEALKDGLRIKYYHLHLSNLLDAIKEGVNVKGYYGWSFFDDFEWDAGYTVRFGMIYVDYKNNLKRYLKYSAYWFQRFLLH
ncbi:hypothetical protein LWI28_012343 [Acer negundo]|uniref:Uncharacterized protein n=1 Tax=Acer negundo TaxID=4023 RepID=A0AAD5NMI0_ACENE|nr:hypothetical protein LWI28_012343 [Acer negundo]